MSKITLFVTRTQGMRAETGPGCAPCRPLLSMVCIAWLLGSITTLTGVTQATSLPVCKPNLTFKDVQLSPMRMPTHERRWTATVMADASRCATTAGYFEIGFSRLKENALEIEFREQFIWSAPSSLVSVDFWANEAVETYWIDSIQTCPCAE